MSTDDQGSPKASQDVHPHEGLLDALVTGEPSAVASEFLATAFEFPTEALAYLLAERDAMARRETIEACAKALDDYEEALVTSEIEDGTVMAHAVMNCAALVRRQALPSVGEERGK